MMESPRLPSLDLDSIFKTDTFDSGFPPTTGVGMENQASLWSLSIPDSPTAILGGLNEFPTFAPTTDSISPTSSNTMENNGGAAFTAPNPPPPTQDPVTTRKKGRKSRVTEAERKERLKAKNRRAQERYRQKKKQTQAQVEAELQAAAEDLERLELENHRLNARTQLMEQVLQVREGTVMILEGSKRAEEAVSPFPPALPASAVASRHKTGDKPASTPFKTGLMVTDATYTRAALLARGAAAMLSPPPSWALQGSDGNDASAHQQHTTDANKQQNTPKISCPVLGRSISEVAAMKANASQESQQVIQEKYGDFCNELRRSLRVLDDASQSSEARERAERAMHKTLVESSCMCFELAKHQPTALQLLMAASVGDSQAAMQIKEENEELIYAMTGDAHQAEEHMNQLRDLRPHWIDVMKQLSLTPEQRKELAPLGDAFLHRVVRVVQKRRRILADLRAAATGSESSSSSAAAAAAAQVGDGMVAEDVEPAAASDSSQLPGTGDLKALQLVTARWLALHEATQELSASLHEEHVVCMELVCSVGQILTPLQKARSMVASYPAFPDVLAIATAAKEQEAEENNACLLKLS